MGISYRYEIDGVHLGPQKLTDICNKSSSMLYCFLDESELNTFDSVLSTLVLTNNRSKLNKIMKGLSQEAFTKGIVNQKGFLHFTDLLRGDHYDFLVKAFKQLNKCNLVVFFDLIYKSEVNGITSAVSGKLTRLIGTFTDMRDHQIWNKNITLVFDESFIPKNKHASKYYLVLRKSGETGCGGYIIPSLTKFQSRIKEEIIKCDYHKEFPVDIQTFHNDRGLQAADFLTGAIAQMIRRGDRQFLDLARNKFYNEGRTYKFDHLGLKFTV